MAYPRHKQRSIALCLSRHPGTHQWGELHSSPFQCNGLEIFLGHAGPFEIFSRNLWAVLSILEAR